MMNEQQCIGFWVMFVVLYIYWELYTCIYWHGYDSLFRRRKMRITGFGWVMLAVAIFWVVVIYAVS